MSYLKNGNGNTVTGHRQKMFYFTIQGCNIGSRGNFICLSGLPKAGKSTFLNAIMASNYTTLDLFQMKLNCKGAMGYFDTESSTNDFYRNIDRIRAFAG